MNLYTKMPRPGHSTQFMTKIENMNFFVFLKNDHFWDRLDGNGQKSPEKAPKTPGMTLIYLKTLKIIDFRTKIIG